MKSKERIKHFIATGALWSPGGKEVLDRFQEVRGEEERMRDSNLKEREAYAFSQRISPEQYGIPFDVKEIDTHLQLSSSEKEYGLPIGEVHEWCFDPFNFFPPLTLVSYLAGNAVQRINYQRQTFPPYLIWIGRSVWPMPHLLLQTIGSKDERFLEQCIFLDARSNRELLRGTLAALRTPSVAVVISALSSLTFSNSRQIALAAKEGGGIGFLIRSERELLHKSAAFSRWILSPQVSKKQNPTFSLLLHFWRGPQPRVKKWSIECKVKEAYEEVSLHIPSDLVDQPFSEKRSYLQRLSA